MNKRRVIDSDDETDLKTKNHAISESNGLKNITNTYLNSGDWLESRDPKALSNDQRKANIEKAKLDRGNKVVSKKIKRVILDDDNDSIEESSYPSSFSINSDSYSSSTSMLYDSILEDTPDEKNLFKVQKSEEIVIKSNNSTVPINTVHNLTTPKKVTKAKKEIIVSDHDDNEEDGDDADSNVDWLSELTKADIEAQAKLILKQCEDISFNLRNTLNEWSNSVNENNDCINLLHISNNNNISNNQVLTQREIQNYCPNLILKDYQLVGVNWLKLLFLNNVNGVLADDMGLGKTIQTIAFLSWLRHYNLINNKSKRMTLIVVPASTLSNWVNELSKFCPTFIVKVYHGSQQDRSDLKYEINVDSANNNLPDVLLTTYTIFEKDSNKSDRGFLNSFTFQFLICDEGHCMKNSSTKRFTYLSNIKSKNRLLLSGTPVQNDLEELLSLLSLLMPKVFKKQNCEILIEAFGWNKKNKNSTNGNSELSINKLRTMFAPFVLRRLKRDVLDQLTEKSYKIEIIEMTTMQQLLYNNIINSNKIFKEQMKIKLDIEKDKERILDLKVKTNKVIDITSPNKSNEKIDNNEIIESIDLLNDDTIIDIPISSSEAKHLFTELRKAANHPLLLRVRYNDSDILDFITQVALSYDYYGSNCKYDRVREEIENSSDFDIHTLCLTYPDSLGKYILNDEVLYDSPKMKLLKDLLPKLVEEKHRILIFSQWTRILDLLTVLCDDIGMNYLRLDGSTPVKERQDYIDQYNNDSTIPIFLLSTKAGGLGINLCAADTVILHDLDFNPENDRQAEDRCHRIGQTKPVTVYKLVTKDTVDELIYEMGERKKKLSEAILADRRSNNKNNDKSNLSKLKKNKKDDDDDIGAIGWILQKALQKAAKTSL